MGQEFQYQVGDVVKTVRVEAAGERLSVQIGDCVYLVTAKGDEMGRLNLDVDGRRLRAHVAHAGGKVYVGLNGDAWTLQHPDPRRKRRAGDAGQASGSLTATMPGRVLDVLVQVGDVVRKGEALLLLEAMKMELRVTAPGDGQVQSVACNPGQVVERGQLLVELAYATQ